MTTTTKANRPQVSVKATYWIGSDPNILVETRIFDGSNTQPAILGLPHGVTPAKPNPGDFAYSGMHDAGPLPPLKEGGDMALLIACAQRAKEFSDKFLTEVIEREKSSASSSKQQQESGEKDYEHETKKARKESEEMGSEK